MKEWIIKHVDDKSYIYVLSHSSLLSCRFVFDDDVRKKRKLFYSNDISNLKARYTQKLL